MLTYLTPSARHLLQSMDHMIDINLFGDGAYNIKLPEEIRSCSIRLIHSTRTHDDWILLYLLIEQLTQRQCDITLILPYISYGRQTPLYLEALLRPVRSPCVRRILTFETHQDLKGIINCSTVPLIAADIQARGLDDAILIAPDQGAVQRVEELAKLTGQHTFELRKLRSAGQVIVTSPTPILKANAAIIIDDMVDTGSTLQACANHLLAQGITRIHVIAVHGVLSCGVGTWADNLASLTFFNTLSPCLNDSFIRWLDIRKGLIDHVS